MVAGQQWVCELQCDAPLAACTHPRSAPPRLSANTTHNRTRRCARHQVIVLLLLHSTARAEVMGSSPQRVSGMPADGERHASSSSSFPASAQLQQAPGRVHMPPHRPGRTCSASISSRMMCSTRRTMLPITSSAAGPGIKGAGDRNQGAGVKGGAAGCTGSSTKHEGSRSVAKAG